MACCSLKPWFIMADYDHHQIQQNKNSPMYNYLSFPLKRFDHVNVLSCSSLITTTKRGPSLAFSLKDGISSYLDSTGEEDHKNKHLNQNQKNKNKNSQKVICGGGGGEGSGSDSAIVQVTCEYEAPDLALPWLTIKGVRRNNNGFIIEGRRLLTCAHCIEHHTNVTIKKQGSNTIYLAVVLAISHDFDLAMLTVSDDEFWQGVRAVEFGDMPSLRDELTNMSYAQYKATITSRSGFISHMGMIPYSHGALKLPGFEVSYDSEIAQSGSAVFNVNGKCVGMAFHRDLETNNPGRVIPVQIIKHFIQDYDRNGGCTGLPIFGVKWQKMENHDLRKSRWVQHDQEGVLIRGIADHCPELLVLEPYDVILSIDGVKIANDGTVPFVQGQRIDFNYLFTQRYTGDNVLVKVLRNTMVRELSIKLATHKQFVPGDVKGIPQKYYIIGGLVFTTLTTPYIRSSYSWVLDAEVNKGYAMVDIINQQVFYLNGKYVKDMNGLVSMVERCREEYLEFRLQEQTVVMKRIAAEKTTTKILKTYGIPSAMSDDLKCYRREKEAAREERKIPREKKIPRFYSSKSDEYLLPLSR